MKVEAVVQENGQILGHAIGDVSQEGDVAALVSEAIADFRLKNPGKTLFADGSGSPTIEVRKA